MQSGIVDEWTPSQPYELYSHMALSSTESAKLQNRHTHGPKDAVILRRRRQLPAFCCGARSACTAHTLLSRHGAPTQWRRPLVCHASLCVSPLYWATAWSVWWRAAHPTAGAIEKAAVLYCIYVSYVSYSVYCMLQSKFDPNFDPNTLRFPSKVHPN